MLVLDIEPQRFALPGDFHPENGLEAGRLGADESQGANAFIIGPDLGKEMIGYAVQDRFEKLGVCLVLLESLLLAVALGRLAERDDGARVNAIGKVLQLQRLAAHQ